LRGGRPSVVERGVEAGCAFFCGPKRGKNGQGLRKGEGQNLWGGTRKVACAEEVWRHFDYQIHDTKKSG